MAIIKNRKIKKIIRRLKIEMHKLCLKRICKKVNMDHAIGVGLLIVILILWYLKK